MLNELVNMVNNASLDMGVRKHLARALRRQVVVETNTILGVTPRTDRLTLSEISIGQREGKIPCIKLVRDRCCLGLREAKDLVESEFSRMGLIFYTAQGLYTPSYE